MQPLGWICCGLVVVALVYGIVREQLDGKRLAREGKLVRSWLVFANNALFQPREGNSFSYAQVVFNLEPDTTENRAELQRLAAELRVFKPAPDGDEVERTIGSVIKTQVPWVGALRLPARLTGERKVYTASVRVYWDQLPERRLSRPDLYLNVIVYGRAVIRQAPYPKYTNDSLENPRGEQQT